MARSIIHTLPANGHVNGAVNGKYQPVKAYKYSPPHSEANGQANGNGVTTPKRYASGNNGYTTPNGHANGNSPNSQNGNGFTMLPIKSPWPGLGLDEQQAETLQPYHDGDDLLEGDPVVMSGIACRLPGSVGSPHDFWQMLMDKRSGQCKVPIERFNADGFYHPDGGVSGTMSCTGGYFLKEDVRQFENNFFSINNLEATYMDPQQRKLLEVVYECFESAGLTLEDVAGSNTGVYVGNFTVDYQTMQVRDPEHLHRYSATGSGSAILANRISHVFDLRGPSFTLDTACSASIYCLHNAVNAILNEECDAAIVAGANLITSPEQHLGTMKGGVLSPDSTCHTFDAAANGYGRGEAVSAIYLTRVSTALGNNDPIRAVIRATAINANGRTPGITQPSIVGQSTVIEKAYKKAGLDIASTDYVESHGTGTALGDPMELEALSRVFGKADRAPLMIGANKPNLGHSEAASGISSLIKCALAFEHKVIPPTMGIKKLNPRLKLEDWNMEIVEEATPWPTQTHRASINSFGYGGANAHTIIESFDQTARRYDIPSLSKPAPDHQKEFIFPVSGSSQQSLEHRVDSIGARLQQGSSYDYDNLCYTLSQRRTKLAKLGYVLSKSSTGASDFSSKNLVQPKETYQSLPLAYVFTGQGAQWAQMGKELLEDNHIFSQAISELDDVLLTLEHAPTWTLRGALLEPPSSSSVGQASHSQPLCTAVQIGLIKMLRSWGLAPSSVVGHSSGEIAAAFAAGLLSEAQAIAIAYYRGYAVGQITKKGQMLAGGVSVDEAIEIIASVGRSGDVVVACVNSPESVTISGAQDGIALVEEELKSRNKFAKAVQTGGRAYHSPYMTEIGAEYERLMSSALARLPRPRSAPEGTEAVQFFSSVGAHGEELARFDRTNTFYLKPAYWRRNLESPVQFNNAVMGLLQARTCHMVEIGPHPAMAGPVKTIKGAMKNPGSTAAYCTTLSRGKDASDCMKTLAGSLYFAGYNVDFLAVNLIPHSTSSLSVVHDLPPYKWTYDDLLWSESRSSIEMRNRPHLRHELIGAPILAGNGVESVWRNQFKLEEVPWIADHKLESQIVFPGAGYLAMAIEALLRVKQDEIAADSRPKFSFREVSIATALVIEEKDATTEMFTTITPTKITRSSNSGKWFDFTVSSVKGDQATSHCTGSICVDASSDNLTRSASVADSEYDEFKMPAWYEKLAAEGLDFGPTFQSITSLRTDKERTSPDAVSTTNILRSLARPDSKRGAGADFAMHPLVIDALLQAAIFGATAGKLNALKAHLPVYIGSMELRAPSQEQINTIARIDTMSRTTGFTSKLISATLAAKDEVLIDMSGVRLSQYNGKNATDETEDRHPTLRVVWKPDITRVNANNVTALDNYVDQFVAARPELDDRLLVGRVGALLDLAGHKNARLNVLEIDNYYNSRTEEWLEMLGKDSEFSLFKNWAVGGLDEAGAVQKAALGKPGVFEALSADEKFDAVLAVNGGLNKPTTDFNTIIGALSPQGFLVTKTSMLARSPIVHSDVVQFDLKCGLSVISRLPEYRDLDGKDILIIKAGDDTQKDEIEQGLLAAAPHIPGLASVRSVPISEVKPEEVTPNTIVVSLLETSQEYLATMTTEGKEHLCRVTNNAKDLVWLTSASTISGDNPDTSLSFGLSRALMLEQPATRFVVLDVGDPLLLSASTRAGMVHVIGSTLITNDLPDDKEFVLKDDVLHVSRFVADAKLNARFDQRLQKHPRPTKLGDVYPARLAIQKIGMMDTIYFQQEDVPVAPVISGHLEIDVKAVSLNAKDIYVLSGKVETQKGTAAIEFSGVVRRVAKDVSGFAPGDRVVVLAPNNFRTTETVPAWAAVKMLPEESFEVMPTLPVIYGTALYALDDRAHIRSGESILVHSGAGAFGWATLAIAMLKGAIPYATVGTESKKDFLVESLGIPRENIFSSRDESFATDVLKATNGKGVDVVVNSLTGDLLHATWRCVAAFGRFVEVGKRDIVDAGKLDMSMFSKNIAFTAFDLTELFYHPDEHYRNIWTSKFREGVELYRNKKVSAPPIRSFDVSEIGQAYRFFNQRSRIGKVVVSLEDSNSIVRAVPAQFSARFDPGKSYLLIGCLGGLGRSLSKYMLARGARNFSFLGRSGADKPAAAELVRSLEKAGASITIVRGDASKKESIDELVATAPKPIGGVVHAAMGLHEALFAAMSNDAWQTGIQPKWRGAWNLHNALEGKDSALEFFLMTSSVSGSVGTATESNYCAANGFLDAFARYRRSIGKPAVSVGLGMISEVGYLHENPEIEALLLRKGIQPLNEEEFLQILDLALTPSAPADDQVYDPLSSAHILTGLEPQGIKKMMAMGFDVNNGTMKDPRAIQLSASLDRDSGDSEADAAAIDAAWSKGLAPHIVKALAAVSAQSASLDEAILNTVARSFSNLLLIPKDKVNMDQNISAVGMDSMIAAEFRSWFFSAFQVDIPFLEIMNASTTLRSLAKTVESKL